MIKQIFTDIAPRLTKSYYGGKILAAYRAYGAEYDFCRFYSCGEGTVHIYNSSMVIDGNIDREDIPLLIGMTKPMSIEIQSGETPDIPDIYERRHRTLFKLKKCGEAAASADIKTNADKAVCYGILKESFENMGSFEDWYVDISHRIRHGVSELFLYESTTATKQFETESFAFLSHIATAEKARGKGAARRLLYALAERYKAAYLFALDSRRSYYEEIGFEPVYEDILYEMKG